MRKHALSNTKSQQVRDYEEERANNAHLAEGCERWMTVVMTDRGNSSVARLLYMVGAYHFIECLVWITHGSGGCMILNLDDLSRKRYS